MTVIKAWKRSGCWARMGLIALSLLVVSLIVVGSWVGQLLTPNARVTDYSDYWVNASTPLTPGQVSVTFFGVSTLLLDDGETQLLVDAFFTRPAVGRYLFGGISSDRQLVEQFVSDYAMDRLKAVFVTHSHVDHAIDVGTIGALTGATIVGTQSTLNIARGAALPETQLLLPELGNAIEVGDFTVQVIESAHSVPPGGTAPEQPEQIVQPLQQPTTNAAFAEGGTIDLVITHGDRTMVIKGSANYIEEALDGIDADVLFLGVTMLGGQARSFQTEFLAETIGATTPEIVVPLHWDDFFKPWELDRARFNPRVIDPHPAEGIDLVLEHTQANDITFALLQAGSRIVIAP
ncbi:MAG: MBL fold metallo-hydrolase [Cyanobacteria bacterium J06638_6]